jgi:chemotaxis protein MotB
MPPEPAASDPAATSPAAPEPAAPATTPAPPQAAARRAAAVPPPRPLSFEPATSTDEWLLTYGDMVTLLLTLFVLLVLTATYDTGKFERDGTDATLRGIFASIAEFRVDTPYADEVAVDPSDDPDEKVVRVPGGASLTLLKDADLALIERREEALADIRAALAQEKLDPYIAAVAEGDGIRLDIPNSILFEVGRVELLGRGRAVLRALAPVLAKGSYRISVEGHTDNSPIDTAEFASNWELSANRAAKVVRLFVEAGIAPARLEAVGHADTRPIADNATADGRAENRRVSILLRVGPEAGAAPAARP